MILIEQLKLMKRLYHRFQRILFYYNQYFTRQIKFINNSLSKQLALTFDDGPHPVLTRQILSILKEHNICATFFLSGPNIEKSPEIVKEIFSAGHILSNHGYEHVSAERLSPDELISGFEKTDNLIRELSEGKAVNFYRPPYGISTKAYLGWINKKNKYTVHWSLDSYDYRDEFSADQIAGMLLKDIQNGDIVLFHDTKSCTPDALKIVIPELLDRKYRFMKLGEQFK
jgi:peptidoglycan/xylan/chitin deacetylase (PgdA/CDA1 family)